MENASKALIIAGAILISILIISFGVIILGQGSDVINSSNMSDVEITTYNGKFEAYEGDRVAASNVKQLCRIVSTHNTQNSDPGKIITVYNGTNGTGTAMVKKDGNIYSVGGITSGSTYKVKCDYNSAGLVDRIYVSTSGASAATSKN